MKELPFMAGEQGRGPLLVALFFVCVTVVAVWGIWEGTLPRSGEAVLAEEAREILVTGDGWTMHFDGEPVYDSPPMALWSMALFFRIFGVTEFAARLPFVVFSLLTIYVVFLIGTAGNVVIARGETDRAAERTAGGAGRAESGGGNVWARERPRCTWITEWRAVGLLSAVVLASSPLFGKYAPHLTIHLPLTFFVTLSTLGWLCHPIRLGAAVLWAAGIAGGLLSGGAAGLIVIPAALLSLVNDSARRSALKNPFFIASSVVGIAAGGSWLIVNAARANGHFADSGLYSGVPGISLAAGGALLSLVYSFKDVWMRNLPWSIAATAAAVRILFFRRNSGRMWPVSSTDDTILTFSAVLFFVPAVTGAGRPASLLYVLPLAAVLSAREIGRWAKDFRRLWAFNQAMTALFCLLMLLLVATPLRLHRAAVDPIKETAVMAGRLTQDGTRIGNFRQAYKEQNARFLFYGGRPLDRPLAEPEDVILELERNPGRIFLSTARDFEEFEDFGGRAAGLRVLFRAGEFLLFGAEGPGTRGVSPPDS